MTTIDYECYVSLEVAKLLKQLGFDWEEKSYYQHGVFHEYSVDRNRIVIMNANSAPDYMEQYSAPTLDVAQRWLREVKNIYIMVFKDFATIDGWHYFVVKKEDWESGIETNFYQQESNNHTYEEAKEAGIKKGLEIILEKKTIRL